MLGAEPARCGGAATVLQLLASPRCLELARELAAEGGDAGGEPSLPVRAVAAMAMGKGLASAGEASAVASVGAALPEEQRPAYEAAVSHLVSSRALTQTRACVALALAPGTPQPLREVRLREDFNKASLCPDKMRSGSL
jgi:hypothetical protein